MHAEADPIASTNTTPSPCTFVIEVLHLPEANSEEFLFVFQALR